MDSSVNDDEESTVEVRMLYSQSPPLAEQEWRTADETSSGRPLRDRDARSEPRFGRRPVNASIQSRPASGRPTIGRRIFRTLTRFSIAVLIGVGATLGWQSYGDAAREALVARAPTLAWLLSVSTTKPPVAAASPNLAPLLEPLASNLDAVRRSVEQLTARQEQMAQNIATVQAGQEDIRQKMSFTSPPPAAAEPAAAVAQHKPPQARAQSPAVQSSSAPRPSPAAGPVPLSR
jgi:hypothetical protein